MVVLYRGGSHGISHLQLRQDDLPICGVYRYPLQEGEEFDEYYAYSTTPFVIMIGQKD